MLLAASAFAQWEPRPITIPTIKFKYVCEKTGRYWVSYGKNPKDKHYCWDGRHYSKADGGVPAFILDYWAQKERESAQRRKEMEERSAELRARVAEGQARALAMRANRASSSTTTVEVSTKPKAEPVESGLLDGVSVGMERVAVVEKLGEPHGQMGNLGSDGDEESLTYLVAGGGQANVRLKQGKVVNVRLPQR
jgi:hypothetical protein